MTTLFDAARAVDPVAVGAWLGLEPVPKQRHKYPCVFCDSSDGLDLNPAKRPKCFACGKTGSVIDLVMAVRGLDAVSAAKALAERFGLRVESWRPTEGTPRRVTVTAAGDAWESPARVTAYTAAMDLLTLTDLGRRYLADRGLGFPDSALEAGFRSLDGPADWDRLARALAARFPIDVLRAAFPARPFGGRVPVLLFAYQRDGLVETFRFRNMTPATAKGERYRDMKDHAPTMPWNADALEHLEGHDLHVVEGELNAFTLWGAASTFRVIGLPGAARIPGAPGAPWLREAGKARRILCWFDADAAGDQGAQGFRRALTEANDWSEAEAGGRLRRVRPDHPGDINDLLRQGQLDVELATLGGPV